VGATRLRNPGIEGREGVPESLPDLEGHVYAGSGGLRGQAGRVVKDDFVIAGVNQQRRQAVHVAIERRHKGVVSGRTVAVAIGEELDARSAEPWIAAGASPHAVASAQQVCPGREEDGRGGHLHSLVAQGIEKRQREAADAENVEIRTYEIIYKLLEDVSSAMVGMLAPDIEEIVTGEAEVRQVFRIPRVGAVAGCYVQNGTITRGAKVRFLRDGTIIWKGTINSLKRFTDDVREVQSGYECGIGLSNFQDLKAGDIIETFEEREVARTLEP